MRRRRWPARWWLDLRIALKGLLVLSLPLLTLALTLALRVPFNRQQELTQAVLSRATETRDTAQTLLILLLELEATTRGFVLTADASFIEPFDAAREAANEELAKLAVLLSTDPDQQVIADASSLVRQELDLASQLVSLVSGGATAASPEVRRLVASEKRSMDGIRQALGGVRRSQEERVGQSQAELMRLRRLLTPIILVTFFGGLAGAFIAAWLFATGISTRIAALERNAERLARGERLGHAPSRGSDEIGSLDTALRRASLLLRQRERELRTVNAELQRTVHEQVLLNRELEAFSYSVSHDLRAPLRSIDGFAQALREDWGERMDEASQTHLARVRNAAQRMGRLIDDLLKLSTLTRAPIQRTRVDVSQIAHELAEELAARNPTRQVEWQFAEGLQAWCDPSLARIVLENLLGNAWKFTSKTPRARIEFFAEPDTHPTRFVIRDNGAGFDMKYAEKLFSPFQRLHADREFPGTGIGLATVQRIVHKHGGGVQTVAQVGQGATFTFTLEPAEGVAVA